MIKSQNITNLWRFAKTSKVIVAGFAVFLLSIAGFAALSNQRAVEAAAQRDCSDNSIIKCGITSWDDFEKKYKAGAPSDLKKILQWDNKELANAGKYVKKGKVYKDGRVVVNGEVVGTDAHSLGRQNMPGSTPMKFGNETYYYRPTSVSFAQESLDALVLFDEKGTARGAIILACGNPVGFTPKSPGKKTSAKPKYECKAIIPAKIGRDTYEFYTQALASNGVGVTKVTYTFDGKETKTTNSASTKVTHTFETPGAHAIKATVQFTIGGKVYSQSCTLKIQIVAPNAPTPPPSAPVPTPTPIIKTGATPPVEEAPAKELPATGSSTAAALLGMSSLAGAGYYWKSSRQQLLKKLLRK